MSEKMPVISTRFVIWDEACTSACSDEDRDWVTDFVSTIGRDTLQSLNGTTPEELFVRGGKCTDLLGFPSRTGVTTEGAISDRFAQILHDWDLGRLVAVYSPDAAGVWSAPSPDLALGQSVDILELSVRSANCLERAGIKTVGKLIGWTGPQLLALKNMGRKSVLEILGKMGELTASGILSTSTLDETPSRDGLKSDSFCLTTLLTIEDLPLEENILVALQRADIFRVDDLVTRSEESLQYWAGLDSVDIFDLKQKLRKSGLHLKTSLPGWLRDHYDEVRLAFGEEMRNLPDLDLEGEQYDALPIAESAVPTCLEDEIETFFIASVNEKKREIVRYLMGWDGGTGTTLESAGRKFEITRERVRQIRATSLRPPEYVRPNFLIRAIEHIAQSIPSGTETIQEGLVRAELSTTPIKVEGIERAARHFGLEIPWSICECDQRRVLVHKAALESFQAFLTTARKKVSHFGVTNRDYVRSDSPPGEAGPDCDLYYSLLEGLEWLDESRNWFWMPTGRNSVLNRLWKILQIARQIDLEAARKAVLRDRRMENCDLPLAVFRRLCEVQPYCKVDGEVLIAGEGLPSDEEDSNESIIVDIFRQYGPVMRRRDLWRLGNVRGIEKVSFDRLLGESNVIVKVAPELFMLVGSNPEALPEGSLTALPEDNTEDYEEIPEATATEDRSAGVLGECDPQADKFPEQTVAGFVSKSAGLRKTGIWSLMEAGLTEADFRKLRTWSSTCSFDLNELSKTRRRCGGLEISGSEAIALTFLACCCEIARNSSSEGALWPSVNAAIGRGLRKQIFASDGVPKPRIRAATESICAKLNIRSVFGREGEQSWYSSVFLQFGMTRSGWKRIPLWLSGHVPPTSIEYLLRDGSAVRSQSFAAFWQTLQKYRWQEISREKARRSLEQSTWVIEPEIDEILAAAASHPEISRSEGETRSVELVDGDRLIGEPLLRWLDEPRFELPVNGRCRWLTAIRYALVLNSVRRIPLTRQGEEYRLDVPGGKVLVELKEPVVTVDLQRSQTSCVQEPFSITLAPEEYGFAFYDQSGRILAVGEERFDADSAYLLLCRSSLSVTNEPEEALQRRVFGGDWTLRSYRNGVPPELEIRSEGKIIWTKPTFTPASARSTQRLKSSCPGGEWGQAVAFTVHPSDDSVPKHLLLNGSRIPLEETPGGNFKGTVILSPDVDYAHRTAIVECEWNGRLRRLPADLAMGPITGVAIETEQGWKPFRAGSGIDTEYLRTHKIMTRLPGNFDGAPRATEEWAWMEGEHFCRRPRSTAMTIGESLYAVGEPLRLAVGPYNRPLEGAVVAQSVIHSGVVQALESFSGGCQIQLRYALDLGADYGIWVWYEGQAKPELVPRANWIQEDDLCLVELQGATEPIALAVSFEGVWLGARTGRKSWKGYGELVETSTDWKTTACWLRWWRAPLLHEDIKNSVQQRVAMARVTTIEAWTCPNDLEDGGRFSEGHEAAWNSVVRHFLWDWNPDEKESAALLRGLGLLTGNDEFDGEWAWEGYEGLLAIHPLLLAQAARKGLTELYPGEDYEDLVYWLEKLRNRILDVDPYSSGERVGEALSDSLRRAVEAMAVDEYFVTKSLLRDALALLRNAPCNTHNLRVAIANSASVPKYLAATLLDKMIRGEIS
jgi:DNA-directed RNA polymerase alpha subunit